ncbi:MAG: hypothetical protein ACE15F_23985 [bacterium]
MVQRIPAQPNILPSNFSIRVILPILSILIQTITPRFSSPLPS